MWKVINGFPKYEINESGVVRNCDTHYVTSQRMNRQGYLYVQLFDGEKNNTRLVHRLVAEAFLPNPENLPIVNHIDECCVHNAVENLEWISYEGNSNHGTRNERIIRNRKDAVIALDENGNVVMRFSSKHEAARFFSISETAIRIAVKNLTRCKSYYWRLDNEESSTVDTAENIEWIKSISSNKKKTSYHANNSTGSIPIVAIDENGNVVSKFRSKNEAAKALGISSTKISELIQSRLKYNSLFLMVDSGHRINEENGDEYESRNNF